MQNNFSRRVFIKTSAAAVGVTPVLGIPALSDSIVHSASQANQQYFEWISYHLPLGARQRWMQEYYRDVAIPALNRAGLNNIGVFNVRHGINDPTLNVIIPHPTLESIETVNDRLLEDSSFVEAGSRFLRSPTNEMAFVSMQKTIMKAFTHLPEMVTPRQRLENRSRIFQVRVYEAPSLTASKRKIHMFNEGGEIAIFKKVGLQPILFGETIAGAMMPNLVYILAFDDFADMGRAWDAFRVDPDWIRLRDDPYYADTVTRINDWIWTPTAFSQI